MKIIQLSDCHLFTDRDTHLAGVNTQYSLQTILTKIAADESPDLLLLTGDLAHDEQQATYQQLKNMLDKMALPYYCLAGNHDQPHYLQQIFATAYAGDFFCFQKNGWNIILINSAIADAIHGELSQTLLTSLTLSLQTHPEPTVIFLHHHPVPIQSPWMDKLALKNQDEFLNVIKSHQQCKAVFFGHIHQEFHHVVHKIAFYGSPSTCFQFKPQSLTVEYDRNALPGYRNIFLNPGGTLSTQIVRVTVD